MRRSDPVSGAAGGHWAPGAVSRPFRPHGEVFVVSGLCVIKMPQQFQASAEQRQVACFRLIASRFFPAIAQDVSGIDRVDLAVSWHPCTRVPVYSCNGTRSRILRELGRDGVSALD